MLQYNTKGRNVKQFSYALLYYQSKQNGERAAFYKSVERRQKKIKNTFTVVEQKDKIAQNYITR